MKFGRTVLQVNIHLMTESRFWDDGILSRWWPWHPPTSHSCICSRIHRLPASPPSACLQFLIHSTFVLVVQFLKHGCFFYRLMLCRLKLFFRGFIEISACTCIKSWKFVYKDDVGCSVSVAIALPSRYPCSNICKGSTLGISRKSRSN